MFFLVESNHVNLIQVGATMYMYVQGIQVYIVLCVSLYMWAIMASMECRKNLSQNRLSPRFINKATTSIQGSPTSSRT
jgi:hypothetical protein